MKMGLTEFDTYRVTTRVNSQAGRLASTAVEIKRWVKRRAGKLFE